MGNISGIYWETVYQRYSNVNGHGDNSGDSARGLWVNKKDFCKWQCRDSWFIVRIGFEI